MKIKYFLPGFEWVTPTVPIDIFANPSTSTTVQVEEIGGSMDDFVNLSGLWRRRWQMRSTPCQKPSTQRHRSYKREDKGMYITTVLFPKVTLWSKTISAQSCMSTDIIDLQNSHTFPNNRGLPSLLQPFNAPWVACVNTSRACANVFPLVLKSCCVCGSLA